MRLTSALLLSAGAHLAGLSAAGSLQPPGTAAGEAAAPPPLRAVVVALAEPKALVPKPAAPRHEPMPAKIAGPGAPADTPAAKHYLPLSQLDVRPQIRTHVMPEYPEGVPQGTRGRVVLELLIAADGRVDAINVERAEPGGVFEEAAVKAFSKAEFSPAMKRGAPSPALLRVEVSFGD